MSVLPSVSQRPPVSCGWFAKPWQAVLWRNWGLVPIDRLAKVLQTDEAQLREAAGQLGLDPDRQADPVWLARGYLTIIRQNWHLCTYEQICQLLAMREETLAFILKEDDFLWHKMGSFKPLLDPPVYQPLTWQELAYTRDMADWLNRLQPEKSWHQENAFAFVRHFTRLLSEEERSEAIRQVVPGNDLRTVYSYFALYGDPLMTPELDPFPDALLAEYARMGIKGVWLQGILYQLVRFPFAPELSEGHEVRIANLKKLIERARSFDIGVYLYLNEPRAMNDAFFQRYPQLRGTREGDFWAICTSHPEVRQVLEDAAYELFSQATGLAGFFTITMSENLTNCYSRAGDGYLCPRCAARKPWEVVAEVNNVLARGARRADPSARAVAWNWAWPESWQQKISPLMTENQIIQCTSETHLPTLIGGVPGTVVDYTMSLAGPGEHAKSFWQAAQKCGLETCAKVQFNNTWEMSAIPWLPVFDKVAEHVANLKGAGVRHLQLSWTLGGYPSPNLKLAGRLMDGIGDVHQFLSEWLGETLGDVADRAQQCFSRAFEQFPFHIGVLYVGPQNYGPMVPFQLEKTNQKASMLGFPYDDLDGWRAIYPREVFADQFEQLVKLWREGLALMQPYTGQSDDFDDMLRLAEAALCHFASTANQIRFVMHRDAWLEHRDGSDRQAMLSIIDDERAMVLRLIELRREDSRIGYESSNHYYYTLQDLAEKLINLKYCADQLTYGTKTGSNE
mgnify:CR=1 FL=1